MSDPAPPTPALTTATRAKSSWAFATGTDIAPGLKALRRLGGGTLFEVYRAWDEHRLSLVVCKMVRPDQLSADRALRILRRESGLLAKLSHPAIIRSLGARLDGPRPHLVLEYIAKATLRQRLRVRGPLPLERALPLAHHLGAALHYLSTQGVVHLDLKPSNVLLGTPTRLIDLSVARTLDSARRLQEPVGTTEYMAPEQCLPEERGPVSTAADVWGLGTTVYEALAGHLPFHVKSNGDKTAPADRYPQLSGAVRPLPDTVPAALSDLLLNCLRRDPAARPTLAAFIAALAPIAEALPGGPLEDWPGTPIALRG